MRLKTYKAKVKALWQDAIKGWEASRVKSWKLGEILAELETVELKKGEKLPSLAELARLRSNRKMTAQELANAKTELFRARNFYNAHPSLESAKSGTIAKPKKKAEKAKATRRPRLSKSEQAIVAMVKSLPKARQKAIAAHLV